MFFSSYFFGIMMMNLEQKCRKVNNTEIYPDFPFPYRDSRIPLHPIEYFHYFRSLYNLTLRISYNLLNLSRKYIIFVLHNLEKEPYFLLYLFIATPWLTSNNKMIHDFWVQMILVVFQTLKFNLPFSIKNSIIYKP